MHTSQKTLLVARREKKLKTNLFLLSKHALSNWMLKTSGRDFAPTISFGFGRRNSSHSLPFLGLLHTRELISPWKIIEATSTSASC
jgi:hypothetical protein